MLERRQKRSEEKREFYSFDLLWDASSLLIANFDGLFCLFYD